MIYNHSVDDPSELSALEAIMSTKQPNLVFWSVGWLVTWP